MAIFLTAIPKTAIAPSEKKPFEHELDTLFDQVFQSYKRVVRNAYGGQPTVTHHTPHGFAATLMWTHANESHRPAAKGRWWSVSAGTDVAESIVENVQRRGVRIHLNRPVWGSYAVVLGDRDVNRVIAWNTTPALEAIHYGENNDYVFISNRPLLVALARIRGVTELVQLSEEYLDEYLLYGYNITDQTAFVGVSELPVSAALRVEDGTLHFDEAPTGMDVDLPTNHSLKEGADTLREALSASARRAVENVGGGRIQLRMSGGKDSRTLLGLINENKVNAYAVTFGKPADSESIISYELTHEAGVSLKMTAPRRAEGDSLFEQVARTIGDSDGLPPSEPHTAIFKGSSPENEGEGIMMGQWPLYKGGMARKGSYGEEAAEKVLLNQGSWMITPETRAPLDQHLLKWARAVPVSDPVERLYLFARQFRSGRWLQAHINLYDRDAVICYPIADSQVTAVADALTVSEKVSQKALYLALEEIWPFAHQVPLSNNASWRFEAAGKNIDFAGDTYEARHREFTKPVAATHDSVIDIDPKHRTYEYTVRAGHDLAAEIMTSPYLEWFRPKISSEMWRCVELTANGHFEFPSNSSKREFIKLLWRIYVAGVWLSKHWLC